MNRIHRLVFSHRTQSLVAVAETSSGRGRFSGRASVIGSAVAIALLALGSGQAVASCASGSIDTATTTTCAMPAGTDFVVSPTGSVVVNNAHAITNIGATVGAIRNAGTINGSGMVGLTQAVGILVGGGGLVQNGIVNTGRITGDSAGISIGSAVAGIGHVENGILNSGLIDAEAYGILVGRAGSTIKGDVVNDAQGRITGIYANGIDLNGGTFNGNLVNHGVIDVGYSAMYLGPSAFTGSIINTGLLRSGTSSAAVYIWDDISGDVVNSSSGSIIETTDAYGALWVDYGATLGGAIRNDGLIQAAGSSGIAVFDATVQGGIHNTGRIVATGADSVGIWLDYGAHVSGGITNSGTITGAYGGVYVADSAISGGLVNTGTIAATDASGGVGVELVGASTLDRIDNSGTISGSRYAIKADSGLPQLNILGTGSRLKGLSSGDEAPGRDGYLWARAFGNRGNQDDLRGVSGFKSATNGLVLGADLPASDRLRAGLAFTVANSNITGNSSVAPSHVDVNTYEIVGYASYNLDPHTDINYQLDLGRNSAKSQRRIAFMGSTAEARFDSLALHGSIGIGRLIELSEASNLTPSLRLDYTQMRTGGYTETGAGPLSLAVAGQTYRELIASADVKVVHNFAPGLRFVGNGSIGYDFRNERAQTAAAFTGGGPVFVTQGLESSPWIYRAGLGLIKEAGSGTEYSLRYDLEGRPSGYLNQTLSARVRWAF